MNIIIKAPTELGIGDYEMAFAMLPEQVTVEASASFQTYNVIDIGEIKIPRGEKLVGFSWDGTLPGEALRYRKELIKAHYWMPPATMMGCWSMWRNNGTKLRLMITGTTINHDVYLSNYTVKNRGYGGSVDYSIEFIVAKDMAVYTVDEENQRATTTRPKEAVPATYTVAPGDSLWSICERFYSDGSKCMDLYAKNWEVIDKANKGNMRSWSEWSTDSSDDPYDMYNIHSGTVLTML